jgi:hypothetical protein
MPELHECEIKGRTKLCIIGASLAVDGGIARGLILEPRSTSKSHKHKKENFKCPEQLRWLK